MEKLKPEKVVEMLRNKGVDVSTEEATQMLKLLQKFANIVVSQHLKSQKQNVCLKQFEIE